MKMIPLTSYIQNPDYEHNNSLILKNQWKEVACMVNADDILFIFEAQNGETGSSSIKFRNGVNLTVKETMVEISKLLA